MRGGQALLGYGHEPAMCGRTVMVTSHFDAATGDPEPKPTKLATRLHKRFESCWLSEMSG